MAGFVSEAGVDEPFVCVSFSSSNLDFFSSGSFLSSSSMFGSWEGDVDLERFRDPWGEDIV